MKVQIKIQLSSFKIKSTKRRNLKRTETTRDTFVKDYSITILKY